MSETTFYGTGRRKRSVAVFTFHQVKVTLRSMANHLEITFAEDSLATIVMQPLLLWKEKSIRH